MKKTIIVLLGGVLLLGPTACKKGSEDPFLSLRSRKNRLVDNWFVDSGTITSSISYIGFYSETTSVIDYDVMVNSSGGNSSTWNGSTTLDVYNDGSITFSSSYVNKDDNNVSFSGTKRGTWDWMGKTDGDGDGGPGGDDGFKNKERVAATYTYEFVASNLGSNQSNEIKIYEYEIPMLKKRDMHLVYIYEYQNGDTLIRETGDLMLKSSHKYDAPQQ